MTEEILSWVRAYPGFAGVAWESLEAQPGSMGLFSRGLEVVSTARDILGQEHRRLRLGLLLAVHTTEDTMSQTLADFAQWAVQTAPILGENQVVKGEKGNMTRKNAHGTARYELALTLEFTR